jgi:hypothetical protein
LVVEIAGLGLLQIQVSSQPQLQSVRTMSYISRARLTLSIAIAPVDCNSRTVRFGGGLVSFPNGLTAVGFVLCFLFTVTVRVVCCAGNYYCWKLRQAAGTAQWPHPGAGVLALLWKLHPIAHETCEWQFELTIISSSGQMAHPRFQRYIMLDCNTDGSQRCQLTHPQPL